jgi:hypothetical protein
MGSFVQSVMGSMPHWIKFGVLTPPDWREVGLFRRPQYPVAQLGTRPVETTVAIGAMPWVPAQDWQAYMAQLTHVVDSFDPTQYRQPVYQALPGGRFFEFNPWRDLPPAFMSTERVLDPWGRAWGKAGSLNRQTTGK